ncbi:hypothetical protein [Polaribacter sp. IC073]|uniref:hypothetical protein n=1 Tax=Polaribacter sp. IC073 TaxID=2508540 RepID=UPI0016769CEC|nr:hypothetical protein [Polaribacter sp. IC073]
MSELSIFKYVKFFIYMRLRSAYRRLNTNITLLLTWYDNYELNILNTKNIIDGSFYDLKDILRNDDVLIKERKIKLL